MRTFLQAIAASCAVLFCIGAAPAGRIDYTMTPILEDGALTAVQVDLRFRGEADGETVLDLPGSWGGQEELWRSIGELAVIAGAELHDGERPDLRTLTHRPNARIHVRYRLIQDWEGMPRAELGNTYRPTIQPAYFHLIGSAALAAPWLDLDTPARVRVRNLPPGWTFASDLEHAGLTLNQVRPSVSVGGDFRIVRSADRNIRVAIRGAWGFSDESFAQQVSQIIAAQRDFWGDDSRAYLVTVIQLTSPNTSWLSLGGTGLGDAFAFFATPNAEAGQITRTLAHEGLHTWIPGRVGGMPEEDEAADYWLSEGLTDFYTGRILVREGLWSPAEFAADFNQMLSAYAQSPVKAEPNTRILADFWGSQAVQQLPYQRGRLLATIWDARLRDAGADFDDVVLSMRDRGDAGAEEHASALLPATAQRFGLDLRSDIDRFALQGEAIVLPEDLFAPCGRIVTRNVPRFHRGFDIEATTANDNIVSGVDPDLPAYAAGVRDGMTLVRRDAGEIGDGEQGIAYVMRDGQTERTFRYMPRGRGSFTLQQLELEANLEGERLAECLRVLGGA